MVFVSGKLTKLPRAEQWAERICTQLGKSVESIIEAGRLLVKAKADLAHGEWSRMFADELLPFSQNTAQRLMKIAEHPQLSNTAHVQYLPPSWGTLYELTKAEPKRLTAAFKDGIITPDMKRRDVKALRPPSKPRHLPTPKAPTEDPADVIGIGYRTEGSRLYARISRLLSDDFDSLSTEDQEFVLSMLDQTLSELRATVRVAAKA
jgi:hypothetical protein